MAVLTGVSDNAPVELGAPPGLRDDKYFGATKLSEMDCCVTVRSCPFFARLDTWGV